MVVTSGVERAIQYYYAFVDYLRERKSPYKAIVAFSGEREFGGKKITETKLNGFSDNVTKEKFKKDPYRFLIVRSIIFRNIHYNEKGAFELSGN